MLSAAGSLVSAAGVALCGAAVLLDTEWLLYVGGFLNGFGMGFAYVPIARYTSSLVSPWYSAVRVSRESFMEL
jgi:hypothetical protein